VLKNLEAVDVIVLGILGATQVGAALHLIAPLVDLAGVHPLEYAHALFEGGDSTSASDIDGEPAPGSHK
tara:strand:+ start:524 stop:730 length:207 start_codon:yes stop_codon:yes gene_type:complete